MSTAPESGGRPINGDRVVNANNIHANKSDNNSCSVTSTVVLDPAAFLANWKKQIQGKDNIPVHQQRLTFACNHHPYPGIKLFDWSCASQDQSAKETVVRDFSSSLQSWQAILRSEKRNIARLLDPEVLTESGDLPSDLKNKTAEEIRDLGIPCTVYYLLFNKCIQVLQPQNCQGTAYHCKEISNLCIKVDKDFQLKEFEVDLYGRLSKSSQPLHFSYRFNGGHLVANLSMLEQTEQYRQGQKMRHTLVKSINSVHKLADGSVTESLLDTNRTSTFVKQTPVQNYIIPLSGGVTVIIPRTSDHELRGICVPVIILNVPWPRLEMGPRNNLIERNPSTPDSFTEMQNNREAVGRTQHGNSHHPVNPTTANPLSEPKTCDFVKQKRLPSINSRKSKSSCNSESQLSKSAQDDSSSSFQTDSSNGCSSTKPADSLKSGDTVKKASKKKRRKKNKRNSKNSSSDTSAPGLKENIQESYLASDVHASSISGNGHIPVYGYLHESSDYLNTGDTMFVKNKIETTSDLEMCTTPIDKTMDRHFSCGSDLSNHDATFVPRHTSRTESLIPGNCNDGLWDSGETFAVSKRIATSNTVTEGPTYQLSEYGKQITVTSTKSIQSPSFSASVSCCESRHQTDLLSTLDGKAPSCNHSSEENCSDCGSSVYNTNRGNVNDRLMVDNHEKHRDLTHVIRAGDSQSVDKKLQAPVGNKVAGNICGSACFPSGSTNISSIGNMHNRIEKESNPKNWKCVWQKIPKHMANDAFHESGAGDNVQLPSDLDSQNRLSAFSLKSEKNGTIQKQRTNSQTYNEDEFKHSKQRKGSENYLERCVSQNHTACYDAQSRCEDSNKSQEGRDGNLQCSTIRQIVGSTHKNAKKTGKDFKEKKTGRSHSDRPIQSKSFAAHENTEKDDNDHVEKHKSSSAPSTPCQCGDVIQTDRGDFLLSMSCKLNHNEANQMLPLSSISNASDQELLPTKNEGIEITSDVRMLEVKLHESPFHSSFKKASKTTDSGIRTSGESDIEQYATEQEVEAKSAGMMMAAADTVGAHSQCKDTVNNVHEGSTEKSKLDVLEEGLESTVPLQKMATSTHVKQTNAMETEQFHEISCKCSSFISKSPASFSAGLNKMAQDISDSIFASYQSQLASESIAHAIGSPLAEFEKVLYSVAPVIVPRPQTVKCTNHPRKLGITELVCRCQIADVPLKNIWHWFEKPGNYGLEVKAEDFQHPKRFSTDGNLFRAYFVPFLSGIQLFRFSKPCKLRSKGVFRSETQENNEEMRKVEDSYHSHFEHLPILSTLLPKPFAAAKTEAPVCLESCKATGLSSSVENQSCSQDISEGMEILFEYFECEQPQQRRPMLEKIRELIKSGAGSSFQVFGDQHTLESINLRDLHPASWFSVAWYPIYRIPEGQFRAAFLTYHSLGHFVHRDASPDTFDGDIGSCIVAPVVGLQSYNAQAECWFVPKKQCERVLNENIPSNPSESLRERLRTLEETASLLARKCARKDASMASSKQSDYEFFLSRGRQSVTTC